MAISAMPTGVLAASTGSSAGDVSLGEDLIQNAKTKYTEIVEGNAQTTVYLTVDEKNLVASLPTSVILSGTPDAQGKYIGKYSIKASGDMSGDKVINISPENNNVDVKQKGKINKSATINQIKTEFTTDDLKNSVQSEGTVTADKLTAGSWNGDFNFNISTQKINHFYSSLNLAAQDINQTTMGTKNTVADLETAENAVCGVYRMDDTYRIELYKDLTEQESVTLDQNAALNLNEHTISFKKGAYLTYNKNLSVYNGGFNSTDTEYIIYGPETNKDSTFNIKNINVNEITSQNITSVAFYNFSNSVNADGLNILQSGVGGTGCIAVGIITKNNDKTSTANIKNYNFKCELSNSKNIKGIQSVSENILIKDTNINIETSSSYAGSGIHVKPAHLSIINTNVHFGTDGKTGAGARIFSNESTEQTTKIENCNFFGTAWGLVTSPVGTTEIKNSKFSATDHSGYIEGNVDIYDSEFFIANRDKYTDIDSPFGLYFGSPNADGKAVVNLTRCKIGNGEERASNTVAAKRNEGYKSPRDINFYDCELYYGTAAIFSYNATTADNIGNTRFNLYGKTKILDRNGTPIPKSTVTKLIAKWKQTPVLKNDGKYFTNILGNFLVSGGVANIDENTGEIKAIYLTDDANVYDYRD